LGTIISVTSSKGGAGKTSCVTLLSVNLAARGYRVAVVDADVNEAFATWASNSYDGPAIDVTKQIDHDLIVEHTMREADAHDVTLVDCPGFSAQSSAYAMGCSDIALIPVMGDRNSVIEARRTARQCEGIAKLARREIPYRVILSRWNKRGLAERATMDDLSASNLIPLAQHIPDLAAFKQSSFSGSMPHTGIVGLYASKIIDELRTLGAIPEKPKRRAA
jgi:chromosome partitioning protein